MRLPLLLLMLAALCAWGAYALETSEPPAAIVAAERRQAEPPQPARRNGELSVRDVSAAASTPLFRAAAAPATLTAPEPGQSFELVGLAGTGASRVAFLRDEADSHTFSVRVGEDVRNWRLEEVSERCAVLRQARRRVNLCL